MDSIIDEAKTKMLISCAGSAQMIYLCFSILKKFFMVRLILTHISLASFLWDIGKQNSPGCDATERGIPSEAILFA